LIAEQSPFTHVDEDNDINVDDVQNGNDTDIRNNHVQRAQHHFNPNQFCSGTIVQRNAVNNTNTNIIDNNDDDNNNNNNFASI
jgi:hypothetical protein